MAYEQYAGLPATKKEVLDMGAAAKNDNITAAASKADKTTAVSDATFTASQATFTRADGTTFTRSVPAAAASGVTIQQVALDTTASPTTTYSDTLAGTRTAVNDLKAATQQALNQRLPRCAAPTATQMLVLNPDGTTSTQPIPTGGTGGTTTLTPSTTSVTDPS